MNNVCFIIRRKLGPCNLNFLLSIFLYPYLCNSVTDMCFFATSARNVNMPAIFVDISRKH